MRSRRFAWAAIVFLALAGAGLYFSPYISGVGAISPIANIGDVVDAKFQGSDGKAHTLAEYRGKVVVLEWTNPVCEFTSPRYASGAMQAMQRQAISGGVIWVVVSSTAPGGSGYMDLSAAQALVAERNIASNYIVLDEDGALGHQFGAFATPSAAVIDAKGKFSYAGAIDDNPWGDGTKGNNYVKAALSDLASDKPVQTPHTRSYGCGIKYKAS